MSLTQYPNNMGICKMQNEIETKPNETNGNQTKRNQKNRNTVAMSVMPCYNNENEVWGISWYLCCNLCILIHFVAFSGRLHVPFSLISQFTIQFDLIRLSDFQRCTQLPINQFRIQHTLCSTPISGLTFSYKKRH